MTHHSYDETFNKVEKLSPVEAVKELRARTHLGLMECKKALEEAQGDVEKALEFLQKKGLKKVDDLIIPTEGMVYAYSFVNDGFDVTHTFGSIIEVNCQTDFAAKTPLFTEFVKGISYFSTVEEINSSSKLLELSKQLGEKVLVRRKDNICSKSPERLFYYNHLGGKIAVLLEASIPPDQQKNIELLALLDNIVMQIAANKPLSLDRNSLPTSLVQKKLAFYGEEVKLKPEQMRSKILDGKMNKWYSEVTLLEQDAIFLGDGVKETVRSQLNKLDASVKLHRFVRYERGESL